MNLDTLTQYEKSILYDSLIKLAQWESLGPAGGGYWSIKIWNTSAFQTLQDAIIKVHEELYKKEEDGN